MKKNLLSVLVILAALSGCSTKASFLLPPDTALVINDERIPLDNKDEQGRVQFERRPFFWTSIIGIEYMLLQDDKIVKKDRLPSSFRIASIFWPPYAYIYWPLGFRFDCYDLSNPRKEFIEQCPEHETPRADHAQRSAPGSM